jgi:hypothetical protein
MSFWKNKAMEEQEQYEWARSLLCEVSALEECENHPGNFFEGPDDIEEAYKLSNARITSGEIILKDGQSRRDLTDLIKAVHADNSGLDSCPECDRNFGPD